MGEHNRRSCRNRKCRTMEYSLSARLFTLVGFDELVETHLSIFCLLLFFCFYSVSVNGWIADKVNISTQINKRSFGKKNVDFYCAIINIRIFNYSLPVFFSLGGGVAGGFVSTSEVINYGGSCGKVSLDSD